MGSIKSCTCKDLPRALSTSWPGWRTWSSGVGRLPRAGYRSLMAPPSPAVLLPRSSSLITAFSGLQPACHKLKSLPHAQVRPPSTESCHPWLSFLPPERPAVLCDPPPLPVLCCGLSHCSSIPHLSPLSSPSSSLCQLFNPGICCCLL